MKLRCRIAIPGLLLFLSAALLGAQTVTTAASSHDAFLPTGFGDWKQSATTISTAEPAMSLMNANKAALTECGPERSAVATYTGPGGRLLYVEAVQFGDYTGAWSAFTLLRTSGLKDAKDLGSNDVVGNGAVLFTSGATLAVVFPATAADLKALQPLAANFPQVKGSRAQPPFLPTLLPAKSLAIGSLRYALGPATYSAQGGVLPAAGLGWDKSAEAITAHYVDRRGDETLTLLLYPTPQIAESHFKLIQATLPGLGPKFLNAKARREAELVVVASGTFSAAAAAEFAGAIHMRVLASTDRGQPPPEFHAEVQKTASLLVNIAVLFGVLSLAAVLLGLFLGGGRAAIRVLQGKPAAAEPEFLSLHLANQNAAPRLAAEDSQSESEKP